MAARAILRTKTGSFKVKYGIMTGSERHHMHVNSWRRGNIETIKPNRHAEVEPLDVKRCDSST